MNSDVTLTGGENPLLAGRYQVVRQLGTGGMGSVWLAEDRQLDNKLFAIKMLPPILVSNKRAYRQLKDEALVAMRLVHPNIVQIRAFEENNGNPFLVMDYIEGLTLDDYLADKGKLTEDETVRLLKPIASALDYAHGEGVVHRDVKPANIMIRKDGHPYILDFGIAREIQETMTRVTGKLSSGTLLYMSPEQLNGDAPKPAQDIYSFAAMVYECLKGEPPFVRGAIEDQIKNKQPEPLRSVMDGTSVGPVNGRDARSPSIAVSVMTGLAKKPEDRPKTCAAVLEGDASRGDAKAWANEDVRAERVETVGRGVPAAPHGFSPRPQVDAVGSVAADNPQQMAIRARVEAKIRQRHFAELPDESGFAERKKLLEDDLLRAELFFDSKGWVDAAEAFDTYARKCDELAALANEMHGALPKREAASKAMEKAVKLLYADPQLRSSAEEAFALAEQHFNAMEFSTASKAYDSAVEMFDRAVKEESEAIQTGTTRTITLPGGVKMEMIYVAPGVFVMGSSKTESERSAEEIQHEVKLTKGFWLGKYPVTQEQWQGVMGSNPSYRRGDDLPVEMISWADCQNFIKKVNDAVDCGARFPTEAEWEYACRAGSTGAYGGTGRIEDMGWYDNTVLGLGLKTHAIGLKEANAWGFHDMHGNVCEWCNDWYGKYECGFATDPEGATSGVCRILRGGCYDFLALHCRSASRFWEPPNYHGSCFGFRLCCSKMPPQR